ncbi:MAG: AsnC family transcriptional regulator [Desulfatibacillaceae bacterium]
MNDLDDMDRAILNRIQSDFPSDPRPFAVVAEELGSSEREVLRRVAVLKERGLIRRIGGNFYPEKLGYVSTLCAARVPEDRVEAFAEVVNRHPGVTHNYERASDYNVWFTFIAPSREEIGQALADIGRATGVDSIINLPATMVFKIRAQFEV